MTLRIIIAGVLGGIAMFIWTSIAHMALPLGETGVREIPNEPGLLPAMQTTLGQHDGFYVFPGFGLGPNPTKQEKTEAMQHMAERYAQNPSGILVYHAPGRTLSMPRLLGVEFVTELIEAFLAVFLLSMTGLAGFGARFGFVVLVGIVAGIATNVSYWNWYGFPAVYTVAYIFIQIIGFACVGFVAALVLGKGNASGRAVA